jgi:hypothetical protein
LHKHGVFVNRGLELFTLGMACHAIGKRISARESRVGRDLAITVQIIHFSTHQPQSNGVISDPYFHACFCVAEYFFD